MEVFHIAKILFLATASFILAMVWTPWWAGVLYRHKLGKKIRNSGDTPIFSKLHAEKSGTPTMGGVLIWVTVALICLALYYLANWSSAAIWSKLNFLSRTETLLPLGALVASALVGLFDDWLDIKGKGVLGGGGFRVRDRLLMYTLIALVGAVWFYFKLDWDQFSIPFLGSYQLGWWYIPVFITVLVSTAFSVNETDGLDGLAGGTLLTAFSAYTVISFALGKYDLATFCAVIAGALLSFLWFNIKPARFYMGDTGAMSLGITLGVIAMLTDTAVFLLVIGLVFVIESLSVIIQILSKKIRKKKIFLSSPIHHHLEAKGWPEYKIVMRFWVVAGVATALGLCLFLLDRIVNF